MQRIAHKINVFIRKLLDMNKSHMYDSNMDKNLSRDARSKMLFTKAHKLVLYFTLEPIYLESINKRKSRSRHLGSWLLLGNIEWENPRGLYRKHQLHWWSFLLLLITLSIYVCVYVSVCTVCMVCVHVCMRM